MKQVRAQALAMARALAPAIAVFALFQLVYFGDHYREPLVTTPLLFVLAAIAALGIPGGPEAAPTDTRSLTERWAIRATGLVTLFSLRELVSDTPYQGFILYPWDTGAFSTLVTLIAIGAGVLIVRPPRPRTALVMLVAGATLMRGYGFDIWQIDPRTRDMLPLILSGLDAFTHGQNPYDVFAMQVGSELPMTYPPLLWLAHLPAYLLHIDIRWTNIVADAIVAGALTAAALRHSEERGALVLVGVAAYLYLPDVHWNGVYAEPQVDWAVLALLIYAISSRRALWVGAAYGLALLTRPFAVVYAIPIALWLWRQHGVRDGLRALTVGGAITAIGYLPFVLWDPNAFFFGTVHWLLEYGPAHASWFHGMIGFTGPLLEADRADWLSKLQMLMLALSYALAAWRLRSARGLLGFMAITYAGFVAFNALIWMSFWIPMGILMLGVIAMDAGDPEVTARTWSDGPRWQLRLELGGTAAVAAAALALLALLYGYHSERGRDNVVALLQGEAEAGDLILDLSGYRLHFVQTEPLLSGDAVPAGVDVALTTPFREDEPRRRQIAPGQHDRVWIIDRYGLADRYRPLYAGGDFYMLERESQVGRYRVQRWVHPGVRSVGHLRDQLATIDAHLETRSGTLEGRYDDGTIHFEGGPPWGDLHPERCTIGRQRRNMVWAHPVQDANTILTVPVPEGTAFFTLYGGFVDEAVTWRYVPVTVSVAVGDTRSDVTFPNRTGLSGTTVAIPEGTSTVTVTTHGGPDVGMRHLCLDGTFWE